MAWLEAIVVQRTQRGSPMLQGSENTSVALGDQPRLLGAAAYEDARGALGVLEGLDLPFDVARIYYLFNVPIGAVRGEHGHKRLRQLMICMHGTTEITLNDGYQQHNFTLESPADVLYVPPGMWRQLRFKMPETVVCVLASRPYEIDDYIYEYEDFLAWVRQGKPVQD